MIIATPALYRRALSLRLATSAISILLVLAISDVGYAFVVMGAWWTAVEAAHKRFFDLSILGPILIGFATSAGYN